MYLFQVHKRQKYSFHILIPLVSAFIIRSPRHLLQFALQRFRQKIWAGIARSLEAKFIQEDKGCYCDVD